jgi:hypothetical protein
MAIWGAMHAFITRCSMWGLWLTFRVGEVPVGGLLTSVPKSILNHGQSLYQDNGGAECFAKCAQIWCYICSSVLSALLFPFCLPVYLISIQPSRNMDTFKLIWGEIEEDAFLCSFSELKMVIDSTYEVHFPCELIWWVGASQRLKGSNNLLCGL